jgi:hypothetical protein
MTRAAHGEAGDARMFSWVSDVRAASQCGAGTDMSVTMTAPARGTLGTSATLDLSATNNGAVTAYGTHVRVVLSTGLVPTSLPSGCSIAVASEPTVDCYLGMLASGATNTVSVGVTYALPGSQTATATVSSHVPETNAADDTSSTTTVVDLPL